MQDIWTFLTDNVFPHYPFVAGYFAFVLVGQFAKTKLWTKERAKGSKVFGFLRQTLALHAPASGAALGLIPGMPVSPGVEGTLYAMVYWGGCGMFASFSFHALSDFLKKKTGVDLEKSIRDAVNVDSEPPKL